MKTRSDIINLIIKKYQFKTYLEIGVWIPSHNYDKIIAPIKESVDPRLDYKYTYNMTSDNFFNDCAHNKMYDVIFIDGMHTEKQTYLDVKNSLKHLNKGGFIIMHDCHPQKEEWTVHYDEWTDYTGAWTGTVYKAFIRLKKELLNYSCFVIDEDYGCGIITERDILDNKQNTPTKNLSWNYFVENKKDLLQLITYDEFSKILPL